MSTQPPWPPPWPQYPAAPVPTARRAGRPGWVTALGVISIVLGALGLLNQMWMAIYPSVLRMQHDMMTSIRRVTTQMATQPADRPPEEFFNVFDRFFSLPSWYVGFVYAMAAVGTALYALCLVSGIGMLGLRPWSRRLAIVFGVGGLAHAVAVTVGGLASQTLWAWSWTCGSLLGLVYPIVLLCFMLPRDRAAAFVARKTAG